MKEIWKDIKGYEGLYQVSNLGRVKSLERWINGNHFYEKILKLRENEKGYLYVHLHCNNSRKSFKVHRLVAETFIPNLENKKEINHKSGIKSDNSVSNLEWTTRSENLKHAYKNGLRTPSGFCKLKIKRRNKNGKNNDKQRTC